MVPSMRYQAYLIICIGLKRLLNEHLAQMEHFIKSLPHVTIVYCNTIFYMQFENRENIRPKFNISFHFSRSGHQLEYYIAIEIFTVNTIWKKHGSFWNSFWYIDPRSCAEQTKVFKNKMHDDFRPTQSQIIRSDQYVRDT
jgi:hypothetical protein